MKFKHLLAKTAVDPDRPNEAATILGHTRQVLAALDVFNGVLFQDILMFLGRSTNPEWWLAAAFCSAWLHDLGKANDHFQKMLRMPGFKQGVRHESLGLVVINDLLDSWLEELWHRYPPWMKAAILFAVGGHHLKFPDPEGNQRNHSEVIFLGGHPELKEFLSLGQKQLNLGDPPQMVDQEYSLLSLGGINKSLSQIRRRNDFDFSPEQMLFIASLKSTLMAVDLAGSALPASGMEVPDWLRSRLKSALDRSNLESLVKKKLKGQPPRSFQERAKTNSELTMLLEAGCGSGKTAAAYLWAAQRAQGRRLFFCYPTTTTASEGFSGYFQEPGFEAILIHSRAAVDYRLLDNMPPLTRTALELRALQLEALDTWAIPAVVCTAHTVLGLLQNERRGLYAWPSLVRSVFVFDEIHSFSSKLFQHLLKFLEIFRFSPVLLMTATIPPHRKAALAKVCEKRGGLMMIAGPKRRENAKRYVLQRSSEVAALETTTRVLNDGGKVLWVSNTIARCISRGRRAISLGLPVQPFHSRYRYRDRLKRQHIVIKGFLPNEPAMLAETTQVAEMSLDLSSDLLVTEYAPVAALIQRLGRLNRFEDEPARPRFCLLIKPDNAMPYARRDEQEKVWGVIEQWLDLVADGSPKSQADLSRAFWAVAKADDETEKDQAIFCDWIDHPWSSLGKRHAIMEPGYTTEMVREEDLGEAHLAEMAIPMPFPKDQSWVRWQFRGRYLIAPCGVIDYDPFWGGEYAQGKVGCSII